MVNIPTHGSTDQPVSNLIPEGRYEFDPIKMETYTTRKGKAAVFVSFIIDGKYKFKDLILVEEGMDWRWKQFLYAIGIRRKLGKNEKAFNVTDGDVVHKKGWCDMTVDKTDPNEPRNRIRRYLPSEEKEVPATGIKPEPSETQTAEKLPKEDPPPKTDKTPEKKTQAKPPEKKEPPEAEEGQGGDISDFEEPPETETETEKSQEDEIEI